MRLIDADALKETIAKNVYVLSDAFNSRDYGMFWTGGIEKAIDEQPTAQQWIPVSERLPEKDGKYLITEVDGYVTCDYFRLENGDWRITFPIAWMPLPSPYKEDKS